MPPKEVRRRNGQSTEIGDVTGEMLRGNAILRHLAGNDAAEVMRSGRAIQMPTRFLVYSAEEQIREVYFPIDSVLSVVTQMNDGVAIEVGTVGQEGTSGIPLIMGAATTANDCYCQVPGKAIVLSSEHFHRLRDSNAEFRALLDRYLQAYVNFLGQLAGCNRLHSIEERCARWLLLTHDRVGKDEIRLTQEFLSMMLGSRRSGVTIALATLRRAGYIRYVNGAITILDRAGLEATSCECYAVAQKQFTGFLRPANGPHRTESDRP